MSTETKHTPGPWWTEDGVVYGMDPHHGTGEPEPVTIADTSPPLASGDHPALSEFDTANAKLMAAAPDLLAACEGALAWLESDEHMAEGGADETYMAALRKRIEITRAAINKARGT